MKYKYIPTGVCAKQIDVEINEEVPTISGVLIVGGCPGYSAALSKLLVGMNAINAVDMLSDVKCGTKQSSCAAEAAKALQACLNKLKEDKLCHTEKQE